MKKITVNNYRIKQVLKKNGIINNINKINYNFFEIILVFIMSITLGILIGEMIFSGESKKSISLTTKSQNQMIEIESIYNTLTDEYIDEIDKEKLKDAAIEGMLSTLNDKHSVYYNDKNSQSFQDELNGYFYGIGAVVYQEKNNLVTIKEIYKDSPAEKAGLKEGDQYIKINNKDVRKMTTSDIANLIKGNNKQLKITIKRKEKEKEIKVRTGKINIPSVKYNIIEKNKKKIANVAITIFASNTDEQFKEAITNIKKEKINNIILDLRDNTGGQLETALNIASELLDKNQPIIMIKDKKKTKTKYSNGNKNNITKIVVLINETSASASEVVASALNEQKNTILVGETTYGKGTVQKTKKLTNGSLIKYTVETWKTSKGKNIDKIGIKPTIEIKQSEKYYKTNKDSDDTQLKKAIEIMLKS